MTHTKAPRTEEGVEWCCDAISGIDDAFIQIGCDYRCIYCNARYNRSGPLYLSSHERGKHLTDAHSFGECNLMTTYQSWEDLLVHLSTFHAMKNESVWDTSRFRRKKRPPLRLRGQDQGFTDDPPSVVSERSNEGKIIEASLRIALAEWREQEHLGCEPNRFELYCLDPCVRQICNAMDAKGTIAFDHALYRIGCLLEELVVCGGDDIFDCPRELEQLLKHKPMRGAVEEASICYACTQRARINAWFLHILAESSPLRLLLTAGRVTSEMKPATSSHWLIPILDYWNLDEAAIGLEQICERSDGAIDSRDDLQADADALTASNKSFSPLVECDCDSAHLFTKTMFKLQVVDGLRDWLKDYEKETKLLEIDNKYASSLLHQTEERPEQSN